MDYTAYATPSAEWLEFDRSRGSLPNPSTLPNREAFNAARAKLFRDVLGPVDDVPRQDVKISEFVTARIYRPALSTNGNAPNGNQDFRLPLYIHYHGGGYYYGDLETEDVGCALICKHTTAVVLSVNYRHTPEWTFPTPINDAWEAFNWALNEDGGRNLLGYDQKRIVVAGASAGAALAIAVAMKELEQGTNRILGVILTTPPTVQPAVYPTQLLKDGYTSHVQNANAPILPKHFFDEFMKMYKPEPENRYASPLVAPIKDFRGFPRTVFHVAGMDLLRDEGLLFERKLKKEGVQTRLRIYEGLPHMFCNLPQLKASEKWREDLYSDISWLLEPGLKKS